MKCIVFLVLLFGISNAVGFNFVPKGLQREVRINGERRIFIRNASKMIIFNVPKEHPDYLEVVSLVNGRLVRKVVMDNKQNKIVDIRESGPIEKYIQDETNENQITTLSTPTENNQIKILLNIFRTFQGVSGESAFYQILKQVKQSVENHELHPIIYDALKELQVQPKQIPVNQKKNETAENNVNKEVPKSIEEVVKSDNSDAEKVQKQRDAKFKVLEAMRAAQQIEWLQNLLSMKRYQYISNDEKFIAQQEDPVKQLDLFIESTKNYGDKDEIDLKQMLIKTNIQEIQKEISRQQLIYQQLENQQDFLSDQKHQIKMNRIMGYNQGAQPDQMIEINDAYKQIKEQERKLVDEQIKLLKKVYDLQTKLILQNQELDKILSKEDN